MTSGHLGRRVSIIGVGYSPMGLVQESPEIKDCTEGELLHYACREAMDDAGVEPKDIDAFYLGQLAPNINSMMAGGAGHMAPWMGMRGKPGVGHDECCATSSLGLHQAVLAVASGQYDIVMSSAVNLNSVKSPVDKPAILYSPKDPMEAFKETCYTVQDLYYAAPGRGYLNPLIDWAIAYAKKYGLTEDDLTKTLNQVIITAREYGVANPKALVAKETYQEEAKRFGFDDVNEYLTSPIFNPKMSSFARAKYNGGFVDGATAQIVCPTELAKEICKHHPIIEVAGFASSSGWDSDFVGQPLGMDYDTYRKAYAMAGITDPYKEVDYLSVHDCSAQNQLTFGEDSGYFRPGEAWKDILNGETGKDGNRPLNSSGGRLGLGHPSAGANGVEIAEAVMQMREECGERQLKNTPKTSVIQSVGGSWHFAATVLKTV